MHLPTKKLYKRLRRILLGNSQQNILVDSRIALFGIRHFFGISPEITKPEGVRFRGLNPGNPPDSSGPRRYLKFTPKLQKKSRVNFSVAPSEAFPKRDSGKKCILINTFFGLNKLYPQLEDIQP